MKTGYLNRHHTIIRHIHNLIKHHYSFVVEKPKIRQDDISAAVRISTNLFDECLSSRSHTIKLPTLFQPQGFDFWRWMFFEEPQMNYTKFHFELVYDYDAPNGFKKEKDPEDDYFNLNVSFANTNIEDNSRTIKKKHSNQLRKIVS